MAYMGGPTYLGKALTYASSYLQGDGRIRKTMKKKAFENRLQILLVVSDGYTEDDLEEPSRNLHDSTDIKPAAVGVRDFNRDKLEILTRDASSIFLLSDQELLSNWLFKQQFEWQEAKEAGQRATTAVLTKQPSMNV